jgi:hypothetical protein
VISSLVLSHIRILNCSGFYDRHFTDGHLLEVPEFPQCRVIFEIEFLTSFEMMKGEEFQKRQAFSEIGFVLKKAISESTPRH